MWLGYKEGTFPGDRPKTENEEYYLFWQDKQRLFAIYRDSNQNVEIVDTYDEAFYNKSIADNTWTKITPPSWALQSLN